MSVESCLRRLHRGWIARSVGLPAAATFSDNHLGIQIERSDLRPAEIVGQPAAPALTSITPVVTSSAEAPLS